MRKYPVALLYLFCVAKTVFMEDRASVKLSWWLLLALDGNNFGGADKIRSSGTIEKRARVDPVRVFEFSVCLSFIS